MPDHLHMLVEGLAPDARFRPMVTFAKQRRAVVAPCRLWQRGYYERVLRTDEHTLVVSAYILANPVRAGLVSSAHDYPFSFSIEHGKEFG